MKNNVRLQIRCEESWYVKLAAAAQREGLNVSEYVRTCIALGEDQLRKKKTIEKLHDWRKQ